eukprot:2944158-Rhodomonas_salina.1
MACWRALLLAVRWSSTSSWTCSCASPEERYSKSTLSTINTRPPFDCASIRLARHNDITRRNQTEEPMLLVQTVRGECGVLRLIWDVVQESSPNRPPDDSLRDYLERDFIMRAGRVVPGKI